MGNICDSCFPQSHEEKEPVDQEGAEPQKSEPSKQEGEGGGASDAGQAGDAEEGGDAEGSKE